MLIVYNAAADETWDEAQVKCHEQDADLAELFPDDMDPLGRVFGTSRESLIITIVTFI